MAKIHVKCACGRTLAVDAKYAGRRAKCPGCGAEFAVPRPPPGRAAEKGEESTERSLEDIYGRAARAHAQRGRIEAALREHRTRVRKRVLIGVSSGILVLLVAFVLQRALETYGPEVGDADQYPEAVGPFLPGLKRKDPRIRAAAAWETADADGDRTVALVRAMASDDQALLVRLVALRLLARKDPDQGRGTAAALLGEDNLDLRMTAAFVAAECSEGRLSPDTLGQYVDGAVEGEDAWRSWWAGVSTEDLSRDETVAFLADKRRRGGARTRSMVAWMTAGALGVDRLLLSLLHDEEPEVVVSAIRALEPFLTAGAFERLRGLEDAEAELGRRFSALNAIVTTLRHEDPRVRTAAVLALAWNGQDESAYLFAPALRDDDWFVRFAALKGLSYLEPRGARAAMRSGLEYNPGAEVIWVRRVKQRIDSRAAGAAAREEE